MPPVPRVPRDILVTARRPFRGESLADPPRSLSVNPVAAVRSSVVRNGRSHFSPRERTHVVANRSPFRRGSSNWWPSPFAMAPSSRCKHHTSVDRRRGS